MSLDRDQRGGDAAVRLFRGREGKPLTQLVQTLQCVTDKLSEELDWGREEDHCLCHVVTNLLLLT